MEDRGEGRKDRSDREMGKRFKRQEGEPDGKYRHTHQEPSAGVYHSYDSVTVLG